ncbi:MAG: hypothetical protein AAGG44_17135 [Planctomycetota bacterium]
MVWIKTLVLITFAALPTATREIEAKSFRVVVQLEANRCIVAASDAVPFGDIRRIVSELKQREIKNIVISAKTPSEFKPAGPFADMRWTNDGDVRVRATGETKQGIISAMADAVISTETIRFTVSVIESEELEKPPSASEESKPHDPSKNSK